MRILNKGFTLLEVIVSAILFALILAGLVNLFLSSGFFTTHSRSTISGGELGRVFLEPLQMSVQQDTWDQATNNLTVGGYNYNSTLDGVTYTGNYFVDNAVSAPSGGGPTPQLRRVQLNVQWQETQP